MLANAGWLAVLAVGVAALVAVLWQRGAYAEARDTNADVAGDLRDLLLTGSSCTLILDMKHLHFRRVTTGTAGVHSSRAARRPVRSRGWGCAVRVGGDAADGAAAAHSRPAGASNQARCHAVRQSAPGMMRFMNWSNIGTVNAVSPWLGLQTMPLAVSELRVGASVVTRDP